MIINHNLSSLNTLNSSNRTQSAMQNSLTKLSSGLRINTAADDAASLAISEKMRGQISGLTTASTNAENGISLLQTAEGALDSTTSILQRMRELAVEAASDVNTDSDRTAMQEEFSELIGEIDRIASTTQFNTKNLLDGSLSAATDAVANIQQNSAIATACTAAYAVSVSLEGSSGTSVTTATTLSTIAANIGATANSSGDFEIEVGGVSGVGGTVLTFSASTTLGNFITCVNNQNSDTLAFDSTTQTLTLSSATTGESSGLTLIDSSTVATTSGDLISTLYSGYTITSLGASRGCAVVDLHTALTALADTAGNSLDISVGDSLSIDYVKNGAMCTVSVSVSASTTLLTLNTDFSGIGSFSVGSDGTISFTAANAGSAGAVYALTFTVEDSSGTKNTTASTVLSKFAQTRAATDARSSGTASILVGANTGQTFGISIHSMSASSLGVKNLSINTEEEADVALKVIDTATAMVSAERGTMGAADNRLEHSISNLTTSSENVTAAESRVRDVDMATEMANYTKLNVISQAATAMLSQANQLPQQVLTLLK